MSQSILPYCPPPYISGWLEPGRTAISSISCPGDVLPDTRRVDDVVGTLVCCCFRRRKDNTSLLAVDICYIHCKWKRIVIKFKLRFCFLYTKLHIWNGRSLLLCWDFGGELVFHENNSFFFRFLTQTFPFVSVNYFFCNFLVKMFVCWESGFKMFTKQLVLQENETS